MQQSLQVHNPHFITFSDPLFTIDILGGVDMAQVERMVCTLRITHQNYPPHRSTLDLYNDSQTDKLIRTLCDRWEQKLTDVSTCLHSLTLKLEDYRLQELRFAGKQHTQPFAISEESRKKATAFLKQKNLLGNLVAHLNETGILGEDENAVILFLALASYKFSNPFSVLCLAKSGIGKSYILQKLSECMPQGAYSFHTKISANALYYFDSSSIQGKALLIEDLEWTTQMLQPLATLQTQGRLVNTRATKDKDGMLHSTTFEVVANLCLLACAYSDKNFEEISLPFLCIHLNHSHAQDMAIMEYQKRCKAGQVKTDDVKAAQELLKNVLATLQNVSIINPFATLINLPEDVAYPRKSLLLLLNFIEIITYFFQYQREQTADKSTGEVLIKTHPDDIELAFRFLKNNLFRRADELSSSARGFYQWLTAFLTEAKANEFTALDIRKAKPIHPRTLNRYLQELKMFSYIGIVGGNKHREGFIYKLTTFGNHADTQSRIEQDIQATLKAVWDEHNRQQGGTENEENDKPEPPPPAPFEPAPEPTEPPSAEPEKEEEKQPQNEGESEAETEQTEAAEPTENTAENPHQKRQRINEKEEYTLKMILKLEAEQAGRQYLTSDVTALSKRSQCIEARYLKTLWEQGRLNREQRDRYYIYSLPTTDSRTVSQTPQSDLQTPDQQEF